jgi:hypothetical protein
MTGMWGRGIPARVEMTEIRGRLVQKRSGVFSIRMFTHFSGVDRSFHPGSFIKFPGFRQAKE